LDGIEALPLMGEGKKDESFKPQDRTKEEIKRAMHGLKIQISL